MWKSDEEAAIDVQGWVVRGKAEGALSMFARIVEFVPKPEKHEEFIRVLKNEVLPIIRKQRGFLELLPLIPEVKNEKAMAITLWVEPKDADRYHKKWFPTIEAIIRPYLATPISFRTYMVETRLCEHFEMALVA